MKYMKYIVYFAPRAGGGVNLRTSAFCSPRNPPIDTPPITILHAKDDKFIPITPALKC